MKATLFLAPCLIALACLPAHAQPGETGAADSMEILDITVGEPTHLSDIGYQNWSSLATSRTGVVAAFYPAVQSQPLRYRTSTDAGETWGEEMIASQYQAGGAMSVGLREGGVLKFCTPGSHWPGEAEYHVAPLEGDFKDGWFTLHSTFAWYTDDFTQYELEPVQVYMPDAVTEKKNEYGDCMWPFFDKGKLIQLESGRLLASMYGSFKHDRKARIVLSSSDDSGHTWRYYATVAHLPEDPDPQWPGHFGGLAEPSVTLLPNGQMLCVMRTQGAHLPAQYRPLYACWSDDLGKTWTTPVPTEPHLMNIWPTLQVLDNGVVACIYGRPGFHVAFSLDNGHTWQDRVTFSDLPEPVITGQVDGIKVGPHKLLAIGGLGAGGTKVFPITVERRTVSSAHLPLRGRVTDANGQPIAGATVQLSPNRYSSDAWIEDPTLDPWRIGPTIKGSPFLAYQSIRSGPSHPTVPTDAEGQFQFDSVKLGEWIVTIEAPGFAPAWDRVKVRPASAMDPVAFTLQPGMAVRGRVLDSAGNPLPGADVLLNRYHVYSDAEGYYDWPAQEPVPQEIHVQAYNRYHTNYGALETTRTLEQLQEQPLVLQSP
jgi:hypothetical protein